jgi:hypothetical protein
MAAKKPDRQQICARKSFVVLVIKRKEETRQKYLNVQTYHNLCQVHRAFPTPDAFQHFSELPHPI